MKEDHPDRLEDIKKITRHISRQVTNEQNEVLRKLMNYIQEFKEAYSQMVDGKSLVTDIFTTNFFHHFWDMIKEEVWRIVEDPRRNKGMLRDFKSTFLTLIPKEEGADTPGKLMPIALYNVIYKIITKVMTNRLRSLLPNLISQEQSGFIEGR